METLRTEVSICGICSKQCMVRATAENGILVKTRRLTEPEYAGCSDMCIRGAANPGYVNHPDRLRSPMRRIGKRGEGKFEEIGWDEAMAEISEKLLAYRRSFGANSVAFYTGYSKWYRPFFQRLAYKFGSSNYGTESSTCFRSTTVSKTLSTGFDNRADFKNSGVVLCISATDFPKTLKDRVKSGELKLIVIDPRTSASIREYAAVHLSPIPGTDGALAAGLADRLIKLGAADTDYIEKHVSGFEQYRDYVAEFDSDSVQRMTGIDSAEIERAAEIIADNLPLAVMNGVTGIIHHTNGMQTHRAYDALSAITGCYGSPGGNIPTCRLTIDGHPAARINTFEFAHPHIPDAEKTGAGRYPLWTAITDEFQAMDLARHIREQSPYPLKAVMALGMNARMFPDSAAMFGALEQVEFFADCDMFMTDTAKYADILLPAASSFERDQLLTVDMGKKAAYVHKICDGGNARSDEDIVCALAKAMELDDDLLCAGKDACYEFLLKNTGYTLEQLKSSPVPVPLRPFEPEPRPLTDGFATPSGKYELYSRKIAALGCEWLDPLPTYRHNYDKSEEWPLILSSGVKAGNYDFAFQSRTHRVPALRKLHPEATADMHPDDMRALGIAEGDKVRLSTVCGEISLTAKEDGDILRGTVNVFEDYPEANVNDLFPADHTDPYTGYPGFKAIPCRVRPLKNEEVNC